MHASEGGAESADAQHAAKRPRLATPAPARSAAAAAGGGGGEPSEGDAGGGRASPRRKVRPPVLDAAPPASPGALPDMGEMAALLTRRRAAPVAAAAAAAAAAPASAVGAGGSAVGLDVRDGAPARVRRRGATPLRGGLAGGCGGVRPPAWTGAACPAVGSGAGDATGARAVVGGGGTALDKIVTSFLLDQHRECADPIAGAF